MSNSNNNNNFSNEYNDNLIVESDEYGYYISYYPLSFELSHNEIDNIISNNINSLEDHPAYEFVENALTSGVTGHEEEREIDLEFTRENDFLNIYSNNNLIARIYIQEPPNETPPLLISNRDNKNISHAGGFIHVKNIGKRKIRYYKNGNKYVIVKGRKKKIK